MNEKKKTFFIVLEGIDGSGKGENIRQLQSYFYNISKKTSVLTTREPTYGTYGNQLRERLRKEKNPKENRDEFLNLVINDRKEHVSNVIDPFFKNIGGDNIHIILCDRYYYSTFAYQMAQGFKFNDLLNLNKEFRKPDLVLFLDLPIEEAMKRFNGKLQKGLTDFGAPTSNKNAGEVLFKQLSKEGNFEKFENEKVMEKIRQNYIEVIKLLPDHNVKLIDASKSKNEVFESIKIEVEKLIDPKII